MKKLLIFIFFFSILKSSFALEVKSSAFNNGEYIPSRYSCDSLNYSPPLEWEDVPPQTKSFVIICDDPDAPFKVWVHWVVYNIPSNRRKLEENIPHQGVLEDGTLQGINDFRRIGYGGPCPPPGATHRYFFKVYALDTVLDLKEGATKKEVLKKIKGHILDKGELIGLYKR
ncbi:MAG: YbhB/YbcL family Raf kinase inhibitor-like protein [Candidatus Omnitrophota bacterium]|nr:YbhB/YbcL family Raf kinase inhibitor-like protein [Candidatus Omnitrophota bacterium]RKY38351.1 MAG: YbhB/YbcL family Raf kinase inhibitor-like protein [Candidatus Omnitrophota bacterium]